MFFFSEFTSLIFGAVMLGGYLVPGLLMRQMKENV